MPTIFLHSYVRSESFSERTCMNVWCPAALHFVGNLSGSVELKSYRSREGNKKTILIQANSNSVKLKITPDTALTSLNSY